MNLNTKHLVGVILLLLVILPFLGLRGGLPITFSVVIGSSMYPTLKMGDACLGVSSRYTDLSVGDIAIYTNGYTYIVHRIINIDNISKTYIFKGDNNPYPDEPVPGSNVLYKVVMTFPLEVWVPSLTVILFFSTVYLSRRMSHYQMFIWLITLFVVTIIVGQFVTMMGNIDTYSVKPIENMTPRIINKSDGVYVIFPYNISGRYTCIGSCVQYNTTTIKVYDTGLITVSIPTSPPVKGVYSISKT